MKGTVTDTNKSGIITRHGPDVSNTWGPSVALHTIIDAFTRHTTKNIYIFFFRVEFCGRTDGPGNNEFLSIEEVKSNCII